MTEVLARPGGHDHGPGVRAIFMAMRNFPWCTQTGEIAGLAAARATRRGITPKQLEWNEPLF